MYKKLYPGNVVRVKSLARIRAEFKYKDDAFVGPCGVNMMGSMTLLCGRNVTIIRETSADKYFIEQASYYWSADMFEDMEIKGEGRVVSIWR